MEAREHQLDVACRLAGVLIENGSVESMALFDELDVAIAMFVVGQRTPPLANAAWRALFGSADKSLAGDIHTAKPGAVHVTERRVELDRPCYVAMTVRADLRSAVVACVDITHEVIARQFAVRHGDLVWSAQGRGVADYFNPAWAAYAASQADWKSAIERDDLASCIRGLASIHERGSFELDARIRRADGEYRWHHIRFAAASSGSRWFAIADDIHDARALRTERDDLVAQLITAKSDAETASRLKDQFLAAVSHEMRAPLTTIVLWEGVLRNETDPALRAKALEVIRQSALGQSRVVADLLDISRGIAGKLHVDLRPVDLSRIVAESLEAVAPAAAAKGITFRHSDPRGGFTVKGDGMRLRQVLDNLLSNAIKFSEPGGEVAVTVTRQRRSIAIEISDHGCGIAAELLPRLFEPFSQAQHALTRGTVGLGLGLAISKQLVALHDGTLSAASEGPGRGATLTMTIPSLATRRKSTPPAGVKRSGSLQRTHVLVVDDDRRVLEALSVLLERAGATVETAISAAVARDRISQGTPDVVICDIAMPGEDGYTFIRQLRAARSRIAAIALTAHASDRDVECALEAGFDRHLAKPVDFERLVANIDELAMARRSG